MVARCCILFVALLMVATVLTAQAGRQDDKDKLQGEWLVSSLRGGEDSVEEELRKTMKLLVKEDGWLFTYKGSETKFTYKLNPSKNPKEIDFTHKDPAGKDSTLKGIYKIDGDTLTVCQGRSESQDRPKTFATHRDDLTALTMFKRVPKN